MAYNEKLSDRVKKVLSRLDILKALIPDPIEKKMFGGICWLIQGNMAGGVINDDLIVRVGPDGYETALTQAHTRVFDVTGKIMKGWVMVSPEGWASEPALEKWVRQGVEFALTLPPK